MEQLHNLCHELHLAVCAPDETEVIFFFQFGQLDHLFLFTSFSEII